VELLGAALLPVPRLQVEHVDAVGPSARAGTEPLLHEGVREVAVSLVPTGARVQRGSPSPGPREWRA
jgi:hypothetical protein